MICRHDHPHVSVSRLVHLARVLHLLQLRYNYLFPAATVLPLLLLAVDSDATNCRPRQLPDAARYSNILTFGILIAFPRCFLCSQPAPRRVYAYLSSPISTPQKKLRVRRSFRLVCFCNPKSFIDPQSSVYPYYHAGWYHSSGSLSWRSWVRQWYV